MQSDNKKVTWKFFHFFSMPKVCHFSRSTTVKSDTIIHSSTKRNLIYTTYLCYATYLQNMLKSY